MAHAKSSSSVRGLESGTGAEGGAGAGGGRRSSCFFQLVKGAVGEILGIAEAP